MKRFAFTVAVMLVAATAAEACPTARESAGSRLFSRLRGAKAPCAQQAAAVATTTTSTTVTTTTTTRSSVKSKGGMMYVPVPVPVPYFPAVPQPAPSEKKPELIPVPNI